MSLLTLLQNNKGTVSSALGKELAQEVLAGKTAILFDAIELVNYKIEYPEAKHVRAGAAKIIEKVAENNPEKVAPYLEKLIPALGVSEPQTRWMLIQVFGYCAKLNPRKALKGIEYAQSYLDEKAGVCLSGAAARYLGYVGALSGEQAETVFPALYNALKSASENEVDWILEAFYNLFENLNENAKAKVFQYAASCLKSRKKSTVKRAEKILKKIKK